MALPTPPFTVRALYPYDSQHSDDLTFPAGQKIRVTSVEDAEWLSGAYLDDPSHQGMFPVNFVEVVPEPVATPVVPARVPKPAPAPAPAAAPVDDDDWSDNEADEDAPAKAISLKPPADADASAPPEPKPEAEEREPTTRQPASYAHHEQSPSHSKPVDAEPSPAALADKLEATTLGTAPPKVAALPLNKTATGPRVTAFPDNGDDEHAAKPSSFRDRIAAFNAQSDAPPAPATQKFAPSSVKRFVPSSSSYVPSVPQTSSPSISRASTMPVAPSSNHDEPAPPTGASEALRDDEGDDDLPQMSLRDRIRLLQQQQQEEQERVDASAERKKLRAKAKKPAPPPPTHATTDADSSAGPAETGDEIKPLEPTFSGSSRRELERTQTGGSMVSTMSPQTTGKSMLSPHSTGEEQPPRRRSSSFQSSDRLPELEEDAGASAAPRSVPPVPQPTPHAPTPHAPTPHAPGIPEGDEGEQEDEQEEDPREEEEEGEENDEDDSDEQDEEEAKRIALRERMAKISAGGMGMNLGMFMNPAFPTPSAKKSSKKKPKAVEPEEETEPRAAPIPMFPFADPNALAALRKPKEEAAEEPEEEDGEEDVTEVAPTEPETDTEAPPTSAPLPPAAAPAPPKRASSEFRPQGEYGTRDVDEIIDDELGDDERSESDRYAPVRAPPSPTDNRRSSYVGGSRVIPPFPTSPMSTRSPGRAMTFDTSADPTAQPLRKASTFSASSDGYSYEDGDDEELDRATKVPTRGLDSDVTGYDADNDTAPDTSPALGGQSFAPPPTGAPPVPVSNEPRGVPPPPPPSGRPAPHVPGSPESSRAVPPPPGRPGPPPVPVPGHAPPPPAVTSPSAPVARPPPPPPPAVGAPPAPSAPRAPPPVPPAQSLAYGASSESLTDSDETDTTEYATEDANDSVAALPSAPPPPPTAAPAPPSAAPLLPRRSTNSGEFRQRSSLEGSAYVAHDIDLNERSQWWAAPNGVPPFLTNHPSALYEVDENTKPKRGGKVTVSRDIYILYHDYSQTTLTVHFEQHDPINTVTFEQTHTPPPSWRQDQLEDAHTKYGGKVLELAQRPTPGADYVPDILRRIPGTLPSVGRRSHGAIIYDNLANATVRQLDEIRAGDIVSFRNAKFQGHKGGLHQKYTTELGKTEPLLAVIYEWDGTKKKIRVYEPADARNNRVKQEGYRLNDLKSGEVRVFRVVGRDYVGWE